MGLWGTLSTSKPSMVLKIVGLEDQEDSTRVEEVNLQSQSSVAHPWHREDSKAPQSPLTSCLRKRFPSRAREPEEISVFRKHLVALKRRKRRKKRRRSTRLGAGSRELKEYALEFSSKAFFNDLVNTYLAGHGAYKISAILTRDMNLILPACVIGIEAQPYSSLASLSWHSMLSYMASGTWGCRWSQHTSQIKRWSRWWGWYPMCSGRVGRGKIEESQRNITWERPDQPLLTLKTGKKF